MSRGGYTIGLRVDGLKGRFGKGRRAGLRISGR